MNNVYKLLEKTISIDEKLLILMNKNNIQELSDYIWTKDPNSFYGHGINDGDGSKYASIWITDDISKNQINANFVCSLDGLIPKVILNYKKLFKFYLDDDKTSISLAREFWEMCHNDEKYLCNHYYQNDLNKWESTEFNY